MNKAQIINEILVGMEDKGVTLENLSFDGDYKLKINDLDVEFSDDGSQATIYYEEEQEGKRVGSVIEELAQEVVALLPVEVWEAGQIVENEFLCEEGSRLVSSAWNYDNFYLLDEQTYSLDYEDSYTTAELKEKGWKRVYRSF